MEEKRIALLVDIENISPFAVEDVIDDLAEKGVICIKRVYCVADKLNNESVRKVVMNNNLEIRTQFNVVSGKNASDFNLVIDAMEILYTKNIDCFAIVSSDSDFNVLVTKLKTENKMVIGYGEQKTKPEFRNNYNDFIFVENLCSNSDEVKNDLIKESNVKTKDALEKEIYSMISSSETESLQISIIKEKLSSKYPDFDERTYGSRKFLDFIRSMKSFNIEESKENKNIYVAFLKGQSNSNNKPDKKQLSAEELKKLIIDLLNKHNKKVNLGQITDLIKKQYKSFSLRSYGVRKYKTLVEKFKWSEIGLEPKKNPTSIILKKK